MISVEVPDVTGAALNIPGRADPLFVIPFRDDGLKYAFTIDERTILFVTSEGSTTGLLLALFETTSGKFIQRTQLPGYLPDCRLSQDRRTLYLLPQLASVDTSTLALQQGYDFYFEDTGRIGRFGDYFEWKRTADEWDEVFHSRELQGQFESRPSARQIQRRAQAEGSAQTE